MDKTPLSRLEEEWRSLLGLRAAARFRSWARLEPPLARFANPADLIEFLRGPSRSGDKDAVLAGLLRKVATEPLAGRILLEALLPGLKTLARRLIAGGTERDETWSLLLACAWDRICSYPLGRRPQRIAANILFDTLGEALATLEAERRSRAELAASSVPAANGVAVSADVDALLRIATQHEILSATEAELILTTRFDQRSLGQAAACAGVSYNTIKVRRQRAERRLLAWLGYGSVPRGRQRRHFSFAHASRLHD